LIVITTSRRPSPRTRSFVKDLSSILPSSVRISRGHKSLVELAVETTKLGAKYILLVTEKSGNPRGLIIYGVEEMGHYRAVSKRLAILLIKGVKLSRENPESSKAYGVSSIFIDYSKCFSDDCFYIADLLVKILGDMVSEKGDLRILLGENKYISIQALNIHGKPVGPLVLVERVIRLQD
jgi:U3 small nucleolar ribonucleoprotein protein IMP4